MDLKKILARFLFASLFILGTGSICFIRDAKAAAAQHPKQKTQATSAKKSVSKPVKTHPEPSQAEFDARLSKVKSSKPGMFAQEGMTDISDNPGFFTVQDKTPAPGVPQDIDKLIRPVLKRLFKNAKLVEDIGEQPPALDGEVEENKLVYVVRLLLTEAEADQLHTELHDKMKWPASPRLGRKPTHGRKQAVMSLFKSTRLRGYSLVIEVNYETQRITVTSYRLGSKYDRLM